MNEWKCISKMSSPLLNTLSADTVYYYVLKTCSLSVPVAPLRGATGTAQTFLKEENICFKIVY